ncbi:MAG TPA: PAS domain-containing protein [Thermoanaerobaculia bacterium]|jgi:two-component system CheB/CheR fusion protein
MIRETRPFYERVETRGGDYLQFIADATAAGIAHCDAERRFLFVNRAYAARFGLTPDQIIGRPIAEVLGEEAYETIRPYVDRVLTTGEPFEYETGINYRTAGWRYMHCIYTPELDEHGRAVGWVGVTTDRTDRYRAEQAVAQLNNTLRQRLEELQTLIDHSPVGIAVAEDPECRTIRVNRALSEMLGLPAGANASFSAPEDERPPYRLYRDGREIPVDELPMQTCTARGVPLDNVELQVVRSDGTERTILNSVRPLFDEAGKVRGGISICTDVTEMKRAGEALREADRRKDEFLATLAHELRNPLAPIRNAVQILQVQGPPDPDLQWAREVIDRQAQQLTRLVDDLLDISRITRGKIELRKERVELAAIVDRALETSHPAIEASRHRLTVTFPEEPLYVTADLTRMAQVLANLLNNAAKYTRPGGHIQLAAGRSGDEAVIKVRDDGIGVPAEMLSRIFELFAQVDTSLERAQGGLGIGLTIARSLVEMHGGRIEAASGGLGRGSEFTVRLPLASAEVPHPSPHEPDAAERAAAGLRILVVDDNEDSAESLAVWLRLIGHDARTAHDGPRALEMAMEFHPEVVLLDIGMPGMNGYDVARRLRQEPATQKAMIVAMTGWGQEEDRRRSQEAGFDRHLVKPVDPKGLNDLLARIAARRA